MPHSTDFNVAVLHDTRSNRPHCSACRKARCDQGLDPHYARRAVFTVTKTGTQDSPRHTCDYHLIHTLLQWEQGT